MTKTKNAINYKLFKWEVTYLDKRTNETITSKFCSITDLNRKLEMEVKNEEVFREINLIKEAKKLDEYNALGRRFLKKDLKLLAIKKIHEEIETEKKPKKGKKENLDAIVYV